MPAIVLRMAGTATLQIDAQSHPPRRQTAQPHNALHMRKRGAVITANGARQPMRLKQPLKTMTHGIGPRIRQAPQFQHIPAVLVPHCQRLTTLALPIVPPAFEIYRPDFIGCLALSATPQPASFLGTWSATTGFGQPSPRQYTLEAAFARRLAVLAPIQLPDLLGSPMPMRLLKTDNLTDHRFTQLIGMAARSPRGFRHPGYPLLKKPLAPLVPRLGTDPILGTQRSEVLRPQRFHRKLNPQIHRFFRFPRHPQAYRLGPASRSVTYVLNLLCYPCSEPAPPGKRGVWPSPATARLSVSEDVRTFLRLDA